MRKHLASPRLEGDDLEKGLAFLKERDGQENPYRSVMTENGPVSGPGMPTDYPRYSLSADRYNGMSVYSDYKDFARSFSDPNSNREEDGYTINSLAEKIRRMEEPVRSRNNGNFSPEMLSPADRERYRNYQDLKYYGETLLESNRKYGSLTVRENNLSEDTPLHTFNYYIYPTVRQPLYREHMNDPRFAGGMYAYNGLEYKLLKEPKPEEIRAHTEVLLNSPEVRNATSGIYKAVKDVAAGDMSKLKELTWREGENYAYLLGMDHFYNVINKEIDLEKLGVDKRTPPINVLSNIAAKDEFQKVCSAHAIDPLFRKGLEGLNRMTDNPYQVMEKATETLKSPGSVQIYMGQSIMEKTLAPVSDEQIRRLSRDPAFEADGEKIAKAVENNMKKYATIDDVRRDLFYYIEIFYNRKRLHSSLGYMSPVAYRLKRTGLSAA